MEAEEIKENPSPPPTPVKTDFRCELCGAYLRDAAKLKRHVNEVHLSAQHECTICGKKFTRKESMYHHARRVHEKSDEFKCKKCGKVLGNQNHFNVHMRAHENQRKFACSFCPMVFVFKSILVKHEARVHLQKEEKRKCQHCGKLFSNAKYRITHIQNVHGIIDIINHDKYVFKCEQCECFFMSKHGLANHVKDAHENPSKKQAFQCQKCSRFFDEDKEEAYKEHVDKCTAENAFICHQCGKAFAHPYRLNRHILEKHNPKEMQCEDCKTWFNNQKSYRMHRLTGCSKDRYSLHLCPHCGQRFGAHHYLRQHVQEAHGIVIPKADKPKLEPLPPGRKRGPNSRWKPRTKRTKNKQTESKESKDAKVEENKTENDKNDQDNTTLGTEEAEKPMPKFDRKAEFKCNNCSKSYRNKSSLHRHTYEVHKEKMFKCPESQCEQKYTRNDTLIAHIKKVHGVQADPLLEQSHDPPITETEPPLSNGIFEDFWEANDDYLDDVGNDNDISAEDHIVIPDVVNIKQEEQFEQPDIDPLIKEALSSSMNIKEEQQDQCLWGSTCVKCGDSLKQAPCRARRFEDEHCLQCDPYFGPRGLLDKHVDGVYLFKFATVIRKTVYYVGA